MPHGIIPTMLPLDHPLWRKYKGGRRELYDASRPLQRLLNGEPPEVIFEELWDHLHHQGDVDCASYAAVPHLLEYARQSLRLDWNVFGLIATIELARPHNPPPPSEIVEDYFRTLRELPVVACLHADDNWDDLLTRTVVSCIALARGQRLLAEAYSELSKEYAREWLKELLGSPMSEE